LPIRRQDGRVRCFAIREARTGQTFDLSPNLFTKIRAAGFNAGLSGWFNPYCRILGSDLSDCAWGDGGSPLLFVEQHLRTKPFYFQAAYLLAWQARSVPFLVRSLDSPTPEPPDDQRLARDNHIQTFDKVRDNALRMLRNPNLNLVFLHMPIPHPPGIWNSTEHVLTDGPADYIDNLRLADLTLGQMRRTLEKTGDWDSSAVLVSSDHPYRPELWSKLPGWTSQVAKITQSRWQPYIPFFLKLPKQQQGAVYDREFNSVLSADMLFQLLKGRLQSSKDVIRYLDKH
jgi:hypothetical protein